MALASFQSACAQNFAEHFEDETLRIDYIFAGDASHQAIYLDNMHATKGWHGKRKRLSEIPMAGNGDYVMTDVASGDTIYRNSFSTLFQEWLTGDEAKETSRSFENVFLAPMPKREAKVTVTLRDASQKSIAQMTHKVNPRDILIERGKVSDAECEYIMRAKEPANGIDIAIVAEGYTRDEMGRFMEKAREATEAIFAHSPFSDYKDRFNVVAVKAISAESGTSTPRKGEWKKTALGSHFDTFYSDRYLTTLRVKSIHDVLSGIAYEHIIILTNTEEYGGGGILNFYNLSMTENKQFRPVVVHEFGHSFAGLADEYAYDYEAIPMYPEGIEPWEANITRQVDFASKWADMVGEKDAEGRAIGLYEGAGYSMRGIWRPTPSCRMRDNNTPEFCPVCVRAIANVIKFYTE